jgi:hypothetical protein
MILVLKLLSSVKGQLKAVEAEKRDLQVCKNILHKGALTYDVRCFLGIFDLPKYLSDSLLRK